MSTPFRLFLLSILTVVVICPSPTALAPTILLHLLIHLFLLLSTADGKLVSLN